MKWHSKKEPIKGKTVNFASFDMPENSFIAGLEFDFRRILESPMDRIVVPPDAKVEIGLPGSGRERSRSFLAITKKNAFSLKIGFLRTHSLVGLSIASPLRYKNQRIRVNDGEVRRVEESVATVQLDIDLNIDFEFPDVNDPLFEDHYEFGKTILCQLENDWNVEKLFSEMPHGKFYAIEEKNDEILRIMRSSKNEPVPTRRMHAPNLRQQRSLLFSACIIGWDISTVDRHSSKAYNFLRLVPLKES